MYMFLSILWLGFFSLMGFSVAVGGEDGAIFAVIIGIFGMMFLPIITVMILED